MWALAAIVVKHGHLVHVITPTWWEEARWGAVAEVLVDVQPALVARAAHQNLQYKYFKLPFKNLLLNI